MKLHVVKVICGPDAAFNAASTEAKTVGKNKKKSNKIQQIFTVKTVNHSCKCPFKNYSDSQTEIDTFYVFN